MLAKSIVSELLKGPDGRPGEVKLISHFVSPELPTEEISVDYSQAQQLRLAKVASDLLYTMLRQDGNLFDGCKVELKRQGDRFFTNQSSLWKVLRKAIEDCHADPICILIDGIDGLQGTLCKELIERILGLAGIPKVKIFLSSRVVPEVSKNLSAHTAINLDGNDFVKGDVETFIRHRVNAFGGWDDGLNERVRETLLAKAEGIYLWASLAIENLACHCSGPDFDAYLEESPAKLKGIYQKMLRRIKERRGSKKVLDMIRYVALAVRPLTFDELGHFLVYMEGKAKSKRRASHGEAGTRSHPTEKETERSVQSCQGFLRSVSGTVSIVHHTAIEYLFDEELDDGLPKCSKSGLDLKISWACFQYLHAAFDDPGGAQNGGVKGHGDKSRDSNSKRVHQEEEPGETGWELVQKRAQEAAAKKRCLRYAAESWLIHAHRSIESSKPGDEFYDEKTHNWFQYPLFEIDDTMRKLWIALCGDPRMEVLAGEQTPLYIAVCLGLVPLAEKLTEDRTLSEEINKVNSSGNTPLHLAVQFDHPEMVEFLVKNGANITIKNRARLTASALGESLGRGDSLDILKRKAIQRRARSVEPAREPGRDLWGTMRGVLVGFGQDRWGDPRQNSTKVQESHDREGSRRSKSRDGRHRRKRTQSHHRTTRGQ